MSRARGETPVATAPPARRLLLVEVPGPWGRAGLTGSRLTPRVTGLLAAAADAAGVRVQLVRRPGRHPGPPRAAAGSSIGRHAWALADPDAEVVHWGGWSVETELLDVDLSQPLAEAPAGPQRLALVCTHARHDVCCAVRGRPVAEALARSGLGRQVWETSHLGGDRFAANLLLLPEGEVFGRLDETSAVDAVRALDGGRLVLPYYRGRVGRAPAVQAAGHLAAVALDDDRRGAVRVLGLPVTGRATAAERADGSGPGSRAGERWLEARVEYGGVVHRLRLVEWWAPPARLTCAALEEKPARWYTLVSMEREVG
ncbi:MAG TPA: sucrase ferredoxin [Kineosporiaceae bacterium]